MLWKSEATLSYFEPQETSELVESLTLENSNFFWLGVTINNIKQFGNFYMSFFFENMDFQTMKYVSLKRTVHTS